MGLMSGCRARREARRWLDLRKAYAEFHGVRSCNVKKMLAGAGMTFEGRLHSGIDDTRNIARIAIHLLRSGAGESHNPWFRLEDLWKLSLLAVGS